MPRPTGVEGRGGAAGWSQVSEAPPTASRAAEVQGWGLRAVESGAGL